MRSSFYLASLSMVLLCALVGTGLGEDAAKPNNPAEPSLLGGWQANSILVFQAEGPRSFSGGRDGLCNVIISKDTFTIRVGNAILAEMSCTWDPKQKPCTIDLKSKDGEMLGIYTVTGKRLRIGLNDAAKGRPKNFNRDSLGMAFVLTRVEGAPLTMSNADGSNAHLFFDVPEYTHCRTPAWSPDGTKVAFAAIRSLFGEKRDESHLLVVDLSDGMIKKLGIGATPSWSPDGKRIAFTGVGSTPPGTYVMNPDGSEVQLIDSDAQYGKWSPKNDELACIVGGNLCIYDPINKKQTKLLDADYQEILWGFGWSPDGQWICFKGTSPDGRNVAAVVHREGQNKGFRVLLPSQETPDVVDFTCHFAWEPTEGKRILASLSTQQNRNNQLYLLDPEGKEPPVRLAGQDSSRSWSSGTWSPDGKRIIFCVYGANLDLGVRE